MKLFNKLVRPLCLTKARKINGHCGKFVTGRTLDVGAGRCYIAKEISEKRRIIVECLDVADLNETDLKLKVYDGKHMPYRNGKFDTVLLVYVLHHCIDPISVLKESIRVCKKNGRIIIFEDVGFMLPTYVMDWVSNKLHNVEAPLNFKKYQKWLDEFRNLNLAVEHVEYGVEKQTFYPLVRHTMFVLRVKK